MKNFTRLLAIIALAAAIGFTMTGCDDGSGSGDPELSGNISITPHASGLLRTGLELIATYSGDEDVSYQWKRGTTNVGTNSDTYTPDQAGSYTVTVSAAGYKSKTSAAVSVSDPLPVDGNITITPNGLVLISTELTADYDGDENVSYQWKRGSTNVGTNSDTYTPDQVGSYTVTVSAEGYTSKTSAAVTVGGYLAVELEKIRDEWEDGETYTIELSDDEEMSPQILSLDSGDITIILKGTGGEKVVSLIDNGSLLKVGKGITLVLDENITLQGHSSNDAALVFVDVDGTLEMKDGAKIIGNTTSSYGSGVFLFGTFTMDGGEISGNTINGNAYGSGVYISEGTFTMNDGKISDNSTEGNGSGVYVGGTFTMNDGEISGNTAVYSGGGVYVAGSQTFTMNGGEINNNATSTFNGGGVYVSGTFTMNDGKISGNTASGTSSNTGLGGGLYVDGTFTMNDGEISGNTASRDGGGMYVNNRTFTINGGKISDNTANSGGGGVFVTGNSSTLTMTGGEISGNTANSGGGVFLSYNGTLNIEDGKISNNTARWGGGVSVANNGKFTLTDGKISDNTATNGGGVYISVGTFTMVDGEISDNTGGGVSVSSSYSTFIMSGGKISGNTATNDGGGVAVSNAGKFTMEGGEISNNTAKNGGGVVVWGTNSIFTMKDGEIAGNTATDSGGGVYVTLEGNFHIVSGIIYGSNEANTSLRNAAAHGAVLRYTEVHTHPQYGTFSETGEWVRIDGFDSNPVDNTIEVEEGVLKS